MSISFFILVGVVRNISIPFKNFRNKVKVASIKLLTRYKYLGPKIEKALHPLKNNQIIPGQTFTNTNRAIAQTEGEKSTGLQNEAVAQNQTNAPAVPKDCILNKADYLETLVYETASRVNSMTNRNFKTAQVSTSDMIKTHATSTNPDIVSMRPQID